MKHRWFKETAQGFMVVSGTVSVTAQLDARFNLVSLCGFSGVIHAYLHCSFSGNVFGEVRQNCRPIFSIV